MMKQPRVYVYIFREGDGRTPGERLETAVKEYLKACGKVHGNRCGTDCDKGSHSDSGNLPEQMLTEKGSQTDIFFVERTETGKPYFPNCPAVQFSISHSGSYWACAVAAEPVGLDLQEHTTAKNETIEGASARFQKMAKRFFHPLEATFVELDSYHNFFTVWTAREAYVKYTGQGIDKYFSEHCVAPAEEFWRRISGRNKDARWRAMEKSFWKTIYAEQYTLCVCMEAPFECVIVDGFDGKPK